MLSARTLIIVVCSLMCATSSFAQTVLFPGLEGEQLQEALRTNYRPATTLSLAQAKDTLYSVIEQHQDSVHGIYSGYTLYLPDGVDPSVWLFNNGAGINLEHVYPQSKGAEEGMAGHSNMHHLYPSRVAVNEARASYPFTDIPDNTTTTWFRNNISMSSIPATDIDSYSEYTPGVFEPRESVKGNIARAVFYFYTMYQDDADAADPNFFAGQRTTLCQWHIDDPIDDDEITRSAVIAHYQDGKDNPFVLDCTAALRAWCPEFTGCGTSGIAGRQDQGFGLVAYALDDRVMVRFTSSEYQPVQISVFDLMGRVVFVTRIDLLQGISDYELNKKPGAGIYTISGITETGLQSVTRCVVH